MRKLLCVILCLVLCFTFYAQPVTAIAVVDDLAAAAIAVLAACGLSFVFSGLSASGALDKVSGLLSDYAQSIGETVPAWLAAYEMTMFGGKLRLAAGLANKIYGFADWVQSTYNVQDDSSVTIESVSGGTSFLLSDGSYFTVADSVVSSSQGWSFVETLPSYLSFNSNGNAYFANGASIVYSYQNVNGAKFWDVYNSSGSLFGSYPVSSSTSNSIGVGLCIGYYSNSVSLDLKFMRLYQNTSTGRYWIQPSSPDSIGNLFGEEYFSDIINFGVDASIISVPQNPAVDDVLVDVGTIPVGTTVSGVTDIIIDNALAGTLDASIEETADLPPVVPPEAVGDYTIDLTSFFPFCIPFDVYDAITLFSAEPVAPNMPLRMTWRGTQYGFDIDLSSFDSLAAILRRMEIILFIVGLAAVTRRYIKW